MTHYLIKRGSTFYFNQRIYGKILRFSLKTNERHLAQERAWQLCAMTFRCLRQRMNYDQIQATAYKLSKELHEEWLDDWVGSNMTEGSYIEKKQREEFNDDIAFSDLQEHIALGKLSETALRDALTDILFIELKRKTWEELRSPKSLLEKLQSMPTPATSLAPTRPEAPKNKLSDQLSLFLNDKKTKNSSILQSTLDEYDVSVRELMEITKVEFVEDVNYESATEFRNSLMRLPKHRNKKSYKGKSVSELLELDIPDKDKLSAKTINGRIVNISSLFDWLHKQQLVPVNPFSGTQLKEESNSYAAFTISDLSCIFFDSPLFADDKFRKSKKTGLRSRWWLLLLAMYTGARLGELIQLRSKDVSTIDGVLTLSITDEGDDMRVKTSAGVRKVPIHKTLLALGFQNYVDSVSEAGHERLLHQIKQGTRKAGSEASKWFNARYRDAYLNNLEESSGRKVFHSFRHTFIQQAIANDIDLPKLQQVVGHEPRYMAETATYRGDGFSIQQLKAVMDEFEYDDIDLSAIKGGWIELNA